MLKALLVDDDMHMLDFLQKMIPWESVGFCVCGAAANGAAALALVQARQPDVVITDVKMPVMDGLEFCQHLNALNDALPVIIISAYEDMETARYAMKYNVTEYLLKPMNARKIELLCSILRELAQSKRQQAVWVEICESVERQQAIASRLRSGDKAWLEDFFLMLSDCLLCQFPLVRFCAFTTMGGTIAPRAWQRAHRNWAACFPKWKWWNMCKMCTFPALGKTRPATATPSPCSKPI